MDLVAGVIILVAGLIGVGLTLITLPGTWFTISVAMGVALWRPDLLSVWSLVAAVVLALAGEAAEFLSSAAGAARQGGSRSGAVGAVVGGVLGAVGGTILLPIPIVGTLAGAVAGAGIGALAAERGVKGRSWADSARIGAGAAAGRLVSVIVKTALAALIAAILTADGFLG